MDAGAPKCQRCDSLIRGIEAGSARLSSVRHDLEGAAAILLLIM